MDKGLTYEEIADELGLDRERDLEAARILDGMLGASDVKRLTERLRNMINSKTVYVYGCGPSLRTDIAALRSSKLHKTGVHIAADGAVKALLEERIMPDVVVTDLDGFPYAIVKASRSGSLIVVHAHGDNIDLLRSQVSGLEPGNVLGTTQTPPFGGLRNFGGFTDGDRAVYLAERFGAGLIVLCGMDFGTEAGECSGRKDAGAEKKPAKLAIGKRLIEALASRSKAGIVNMTSGGEDLSGVPRIDARQIMEFI